MCEARLDEDLTFALLEELDVRSGARARAAAQVEEPEDDDEPWRRDVDRRPTRP